MRIMNILLTHPKLSGITGKIQERCPVPITGSTSYKDVLIRVIKGDVEKLGIVFDVVGIDILRLISLAHEVEPELPILAWDCPPPSFDKIVDYPELLEDHIFFIDSRYLEGDPFFECFNKFYCGTLTPFDFVELEKHS